TRSAGHIAAPIQIEPLIAGLLPTTCARLAVVDGSGPCRGSRGRRGWTADTAMNPAVLDAFALVIAAASEQAVYPGLLQVKNRYDPGGLFTMASAPKPEAPSASRNAAKAC